MPLKSVNCNIENNISWAAYPNPATDLLKVNISSDVLMDNAYFQMLDMAGKVIFEKVFSLEFGHAEVMVNVESLSKGAYILKVIGDNLGALAPLKVVVN